MSYCLATVLNYAKYLTKPRLPQVSFCRLRFDVCIILELDFISILQCSFLACQRSSFQYWCALQIEVLDQRRRGDREKEILQDFLRDQILVLQLISDRIILLPWFYNMVNQKCLKISYPFLTCEIMKILILYFTSG